jgi:hypothetical protein
LKDLGSEFEKLLEAKDEEILSLKNKLDLMEAELRSKDNNLESLKEDNEGL